MSWKKVTIEQIAKAITDYYIENGLAASAPELAKFMGCSVGTVRKVLTDKVHTKGNLPFQREERNWNFVEYGFKEHLGVRGKENTREFLPVLRTLRSRILESRVELAPGETLDSLYEEKSRISLVDKLSTEQISRLNEINKKLYTMEPNVVFTEDPS